jgi:hypothetical protein
VTEAQQRCLLCAAERITPWLFEDEECWVAECMVCATPMIVRRTHGLPDADLEALLLAQLERVAVERYGDGGYWVDAERRRIPDHWHAHARPAGGFFDPASELYGSF